MTRHLLALPFAALLLIGASCQAAIIGSGLTDWGIAGLELLAGICVTGTFTLWETSLQEHIPDRSLSRVSSYDYLSSAGIRCFVRARKFIEPRGGKVAIVNPQPGVRKVLDIVKAMPSAGIFGSIAELDEYLDAMQKQVRNE